MSTRIVTYNIEWFDDHFNADNSMKTGEEAQAKFAAVRDVLNMIDADLITIVEAPNTTTTTGIQDTIAKLETFATTMGLRTKKAAIGYISAGRQEIAILYDDTKMTVTHSPGGKNTLKNPKFNDEFRYDADQDRVLEIYKHYRPPFEALVTLQSGEAFHLIGVHAKSKGIFNSVDQIHLERESRRNRMKLFAECAWIRRRVDEWLDDGKRFAVLGDINDGPGMDSYEFSFGRSAVEVVMGNIFEPDRILRNYLGEPKWENYGWVPASASFKDRITEDYINVLIDHILASPNLPVVDSDPAIVWNPFQNDAISQHRDTFLAASDHFPITLDIDLD